MFQARLSQGYLLVVPKLMRWLLGCQEHCRGESLPAAAQQS